MSFLMSDAIMAAIQHGDSVGWKSNKERRKYMDKYNEAVSMEKQFADFFLRQSTTMIQQKALIIIKISKKN